MAEGRRVLVAVNGDGVSRGAVVEAVIHGLSSHGSGVGRLADGRTVFVPRTAPGDRVRVRLGKVKPRWAEGALVEVIEASPDRRRPPCTRYDTCGGCQLQHVGEDVQREWKGRNVAETLARIGGVARSAPPEVVPSPDALGYRNRMSFTLRRLPDGHVVAGLHALGRPAHVVDLDGECLLPEPAVADAWRALRRAWGPGAARLPVGGRLRLTLRAAPDGSGVGLLIEGGKPGWDPAPLLAAADAFASAIHRPAAGPGGASAAESAPGATEGGAPEDGDDPTGPLGFEQVNTGAAALLRAHVVAEAGEARHIVDAYCGQGAYGRPLAEGGATVVGIELDPDGAAEARRSAPTGFTVREGRVEDVLPDLLPADLLVLNPPRAGVGPAVVEAVLARPPARVVYVSCDPATLARDLAGLTSRYDVEAVRCFDLFPQTAHVETVVTLNLRRTD